MAKASRDKGIRGELEVCAVFQEFGFECHRVPNSGGLWIPGDIAGLDALHVEVKRQERLDIPGWLRQAYADAPRGVHPLVAFRRNARRPGDPLGNWHVVLSLVGFVNTYRDALSAKGSESLRG